MTVEINAFKQHKIISTKNNYLSNYIKITNQFNEHILNISKTNINIQLKKTALNKLKINYLKNVKTLKDKFKMDIFNIKKLQLPTIVKPYINKKAVLIGINYIGTPNELNGCINDAESIKKRLIDNNFTDITTITDLTDIKPTRDVIIKYFTNLLKNSSPGDLLCFIYSGHGSYLKDTNNDEIDGRDEVIVPLDLNFIKDDELKTIIQKYLKKGVTLFAMFDSCFSGTVLDLKYQYLDSLNYDKVTENKKNIETLGNVLMISGCTDKQTSSDAFFNNKAQGAMTWSFLEALQTQPLLTWRQLVKSMRAKLKESKFKQIPQFSSGKITNIDMKIFI